MENRLSNENVCSLHQAENMIEHSRIAVTEEQKYLYILLREVKSSPRKTYDDQNLEKLIVELEPWKLSDNHLLVEVFRLTGDETNRELFVLSYPHVFGLG